MGLGNVSKASFATKSNAHANVTDDPLRVGALEDLPENLPRVEDDVAWRR